MIERHEDGPEVLNMVLTQLPNYIDALANVAAAWCAYKGLWRAKEQRTVKLRSGKHTFEGPIKSSRDLRLIAATLKSLK